MPADVTETPGEGIAGRVDGREVIVGGLHFVASRIGGDPHPLLGRERLPGALAAAVAADGKLIGDIVRLDADRIAAGVEHRAVLTFEDERGRRRARVAAGAAVGEESHAHAASFAEGEAAALARIYVDVGTRRKARSRATRGESAVGHTCRSTLPPGVASVR